MEEQALQSDLEERTTFKMHKLNKWSFLRITIIISNIIFAINISEQKNNVDWVACFLISASFSATLFAWLTLIRKNTKVDFYANYSLTYPFFPINKYPVQFWLLGAFAFIISGGIAIMISYIKKQNNLAFCGTIFFWGLGIFTSIKIWQRVFRIPPVENTKQSFSIKQ